MSSQPQHRPSTPQISTSVLEQNTIVVYQRQPKCAPLRLPSTAAVTPSRTTSSSSATPTMRTTAAKCIRASSASRANAPDVHAGSSASSNAGRASPHMARTTRMRRRRHHHLGRRRRRCPAHLPPLRRLLLPRHRVVPATFKESVAVPPQLKCSPAESWLCECWDHSSRGVAQALLKQQDADGREELLQLSSPIPAKDSQSCTIDALLAENRRLALTVMLQTRIMTTELTASELRGKNDMLAQEARENEERLGELAGRKG